MARYTALGDGVVPIESLAELLAQTTLLFEASTLVEGLVGQGRTVQAALVVDVG